MPERFSLPLKKPVDESSSWKITMSEGGLGDAVLEAVGNSAKVVKLAVREIPQSGPPEALLDKYGISSKHIVQAVKSF